MIIGIDASRANRKYKTGPEWYSYHLIRELAAIDSDNEYVLYTNEPLMPELLDLKSQPAGREKVAAAASAKSQILRSPHDNFKIKLLKWPFSFFWTQGRLSLEMFISPPGILFVPAHAVPFIHPRRTVNTVHDIGFEIDRKFYKPEYLGPGAMLARRPLNFFIKLITYGKYGANSKDYLSWSTGYTLKKSKLVIVPSEFTRQELIRQYNAQPDKIKVISNGYDSKLFHRNIDPETTKRVLAKHDIKPPYLLYVGKLDTKKNTHALVQAFGIYKQRAKSRDIKLVLIGTASFGYDEVTYMMHEYMLDNDIYMPGWLPQEEMPHIYAGAEAFIYPSLYDGFGIPLLEAMACGIPVAASNKASIPEVVGDAALIFEPTSAPSIVNAINEIINNRELRQNLILKGLERSAQYSWKKCAKETLEALSGL